MIKICDKAMYRNCKEEIPKPRDAEYLLELAKKKAEARRKGPHSTGTDLMEDVFR